MGSKVANKSANEKSVLTKKKGMKATHSKLRPIYPKTNRLKNYPGKILEIGKSPRWVKVRNGQKSGCFPTSERARGQKPPRPTVTKFYPNRISS